MNRILWVSRFLPFDGSMAGHKTFTYYFKGMYDTELFDFYLLAFREYNDLDDKIKQLNIKTRFVYKHQPIVSIPELRILFSKIFSIINPLNKYGGLLSYSEVKSFENQMVKIKMEGFNPEVVILEWTECVFLAEIVKRVFPTSRIIASEHDVTYIGFLRRVNRSKWIKREIYKCKYINIKRLELTNLQLCDVIYPHNYDNKVELEKDGININCVKRISPYYDNYSSIKRNNINNCIIFFGAMNRCENYLSVEWFIDKVIPLLDDIDVKFVVIGGSPPNHLKKMESDKVMITGYVDDVKPYFANSMCLVAPLVLGAGIKIKIIEALSSGIPVLTNRIGIEGIQAVSGKDYIHCETPEDYSREIHNIFYGVVDCNALSLNEKKLVNEQFDIQNSLDEYVNIVTDIIKSVSPNDRMGLIK